MSNIKVFDGVSNRTDYQVAIVAARFNSAIVKNLVEGALDVFRRSQIPNATVYWVDGAFEIPVVCKRILDAGKADGIVALGAVIRGETAHFDFVAGNCAAQIASLSTQSGKPIAFGVLTTDTVEQAMNRAGLKLGNKGSEAAQTLLQTLALFEQAEI